MSLLIETNSDNIYDFYLRKPNINFKTLAQLRIKKLLKELKVNRCTGRTRHGSKKTMLKAGLSFLYQSPEKWLKITESIENNKSISKLFQFIVGTNNLCLFFEQKGKIIIAVSELENDDIDYGLRKFKDDFIEKEISKKTTKFMKFEDFINHSIGCFTPQEMLKNPFLNTLIADSDLLEEYIYAAEIMKPPFLSNKILAVNMPLNHASDYIRLIGEERNFGFRISSSIIDPSNFLSYH